MHQSITSYKSVLEKAYLLLSLRLDCVALYSAGHTWCQKHTAYCQLSVGSNLKFNSTLISHVEMLKLGIHGLSS